MNVLRHDVLANLIGQLLLNHPNKAIRVLCQSLLIGLASDSKESRSIPLQQLSFTILAGLLLSIKSDNPIQLRNVYSRIIDELIQLLQYQKAQLRKMSPEELEQWVKDRRNEFETIIAEKSITGFAQTELAKKISWQLQDPTAVCLAYALQAAICRHSFQHDTNIASCLVDALSVFAKSEKNSKKVLVDMIREVNKSLEHLCDKIDKADDEQVQQAIDSASVILTEFPKQALWREEDE